MRTFKHPAFDIWTTVEDDKVDEHIAAGWVPVLDDDQQARFEEIELETELAPTPEPTPKTPHRQRRGQ